MTPIPACEQLSVYRDRRLAWCQATPAANPDTCHNESSLASSCRCRTQRGGSTSWKKGIPLCHKKLQAPLKKIKSQFITNSPSRGVLCLRI